MDSRSASTHGEEDSREKKLRIDVTRLHEEHQRRAYDEISQQGNPPHAQPVRDDAPDGTHHKRYDFIRKPKRPDTLRDTTLA